MPVEQIWGYGGLLFVLLLVSEGGSRKEADKEL